MTDTYVEEKRFLDIYDICVRLKQITCLLDIVLEQTYKDVCSTEKVLESFGVSELMGSLKDDTEALNMVNINALELYDECTALKEKECKEKASS